MIAKSNLGKGIKGAVEYALDVKNEGEKAEVLSTNRVSPFSAPTAIMDFHLERGKRPDVKNVIMHVTLSFSKEDRVDDQRLAELSEKFIERMGWGDHQYMIVKHDDKDHPHTHLLVNRVGPEGQLLDDKFYKTKIRKEAQAMELDYGLTVASDRKVGKVAKMKSPDHDQAKEKIAGMIKAIEGKSTVCSMDQFKAYMELQGVEVKLRNKGISFDIDGVKIKGSQVGRDYSYMAIKKRLVANFSKNIQETAREEQAQQKQLEQDFRSSVKEAVFSLLENPELQQRGDFKSMLKKDYTLEMHREGEEVTRMEVTRNDEPEVSISFDRLAFEHLVQQYEEEYKAAKQKAAEEREAKEKKAKQARREEKEAKLAVKVEQALAKATSWVDLSNQLFQKGIEMQRQPPNARFPEAVTFYDHQSRVSIQMTPEMLSEATKMLESRQQQQQQQKGKDNERNNGLKM